VAPVFRAPLQHGGAVPEGAKEVIADEQDFRLSGAQTR